MLAAPRLSAAGSGGGKASLHLGEHEILDQKVNCGEHPEHYGNNDSAPEQGLAPTHRSSRPHATGSGQPHRELSIWTEVAVDERLDRRWQLMPGEIGAA